MQRLRWDGVGAPAWRVLRSRQWVKNVFVLRPLVFAQELADRQAVLTRLLAFALFCVLSSSVYVLNDLVDAESDRLHPDKRYRPIASGSSREGTAAVMALVLALAGLAGHRLPGDRPSLSSPPGYLVLNLGLLLRPEAGGRSWT